MSGSELKRDFDGPGDDAFDHPERLRAMYHPPADPLLEPTANFPLGFYEDFLREINRLGIVVLTYDDFFHESDDCDYESNYAREYKSWLKNARDPKKIYLVIQHDVDNHPHFTQRMIAMEFIYNVRSNIFIFHQRYSQTQVNPQYDVDHDFFRAAERRGFVIGYHQNALQLAGFDLDEAARRYRDDVAALRRIYNIRYVVPHGGIGAVVHGRMHHNVDVPMPLELRANLRWVFNGHGAKFSSRWSDGGLRRMRDRRRVRDYDIISRFLHQLKPGTRNFCLVHPQRWGFHIDINANPLLAEHEWYQRMCRQYPVALAGGGAADADQADEAAGAALNNCAFDAKSPAA